MALPLAASGQVTPWIAALGMALSSLLVTLNALRLTRDGALTMAILLVLVPISLVLLGLAIWAFVWAVRSGQYDDLDAPAIDMLRKDASKPGSPPPGPIKERDAD